MSHPQPSASSCDSQAYKGRERGPRGRHSHAVMHHSAQKLPCIPSITRSSPYHCYQASSCCTAFRAYLSLHGTRATAAAHQLQGHDEQYHVSGVDSGDRRTGPEEYLCWRTATCRMLPAYLTSVNQPSNMPWDHSGLDCNCICMLTATPPDSH